jgi:hypothetical protein
VKHARIDDLSVFAHQLGLIGATFFATGFLGYLALHPIF